MAFEVVLDRAAVLFTGSTAARVSSSLTVSARVPRATGFFALEAAVSSSVVALVRVVRFGGRAVFEELATLAGGAASSSDPDSCVARVRVTRAAGGFVVVSTGLRTGLLTAVLVASGAISNDFVFRGGSDFGPGLLDFF
jgi:hypothetical protein